MVELGDTQVLGERRAFEVPDDVRKSFEGCAAGKASDDYLFTWPNGDRILDFRGAWKKAKVTSGVKDSLFHNCVRQP